jgi:glutathione synthase/RimK-type ligase-like ATP-grasp enzyme
MLVQKLGLRYAAIDLIETPKGDFVFLEANPNGQYSWLENDLGLPISDAIASELAADTPPARMRTSYGG